MQLDKGLLDQNIGPMQSHINVGNGQDITISELAKLIAEVVSFEGKIVFDSSKLDGAPSKWMDSKKLMQLGWLPKIRLSDGLENAYRDYLYQMPC